MPNVNERAADPCAARSHNCRCPLPDIEALAEQQPAERNDTEQRFRALFVSARRERLAELDALTDQIQPLLDRLDATWAHLEAHGFWTGRRQAVP